MTYPPMKWFDNEFLPGAPPADAMKVLNDNLYKFTDGTTCTKEQLAAREALLMEDDIAQLN